MKCMHRPGPRRANTDSYQQVSKRHQESKLSMTKSHLLDENFHDAFANLHPHTFFLEHVQKWQKFFLKTKFKKKKTPPCYLYTLLKGTHGSFSSLKTKELLVSGADQRGPWVREVTQRLETTAVQTTSLCPGVRLAPVNILVHHLSNIYFVFFC